MNMKDSSPNINRSKSLETLKVNTPLYYSAYNVNSKNILGS